MKALFSRVTALIFFAIVLALGCGTPSLNRQATKNKLEAAKETQDENQQKKVEIGVVQVDAGRRALQKDPFPSTNSVIAEKRLDSALIAFQSAGVTPAAKELFESRKAIDSLLSTNNALALTAEGYFKKLDRLVETMEIKDRLQEEKIASLVVKLEKQDLNNATDADTLTTIKKWLWWGFLGFIALIVIKIGWQVIQVWGMFNPAIKLGALAIKAPARVIADGFAELVKGGENFKERIDASSELTPELKAKVSEWFASEHKQAQDQDTKEIVKRLTNL